MYTVDSRAKSVIFPQRGSNKGEQLLVLKVNLTLIYFVVLHFVFLVGRTVLFV